MTPLSRKLYAMKQAAEEALEKLGKIAIPETEAAKYVYERGYYEGFLDALTQIKSWNDASFSSQLPANCVAAPNDKPV